MLPRTLIWKDDRLAILDQRRIPWEVSYCICKNYSEVAHAIEKLTIRGAPAIWIAAAYGVALAALEGPDSIIPAIERLSQTRPTAVNLFWSLKRMEAAFYASQEKDVPRTLLNEAHQILAEDIRINRVIGKKGAEILPETCSIITHCNAGALATGGHGTALGIIRTAKEMGKTIRVFADETRPVLQGARLTVWELMQDDIDVTLICDNMAGSLMKDGKIDAVIVGADRVTSRGDVANKIGTYQLAILSQYHSIPFYVAAPLSTFDWSLLSGEDIPIERREASEVLCLGGDASLPDNYCVYNPAFDVTPSELISAIVTEKGLIMAPVSVNIDSFKKKL